MPLVIEQNVATDPLHVCLLRADAVVPDAHQLANLFQQPRRAGRFHVQTTSVLVDDDNGNGLRWPPLTHLQPILRETQQNEDVQQHDSKRTSGNEPQENTPLITSLRPSTY